LANESPRSCGEAHAPLGGHLARLDAVHEKAGVGVCGLERGTAVAPRECPFSPGQIQAPFLVRTVVTFQAVAGQQGSRVLIDGCRWRRGGWRTEGRPDQATEYSRDRAHN